MSNTKKYTTAQTLKSIQRRLDALELISVSTHQILKKNNLLPNNKTEKLIRDKIREELYPINYKGKDWYSKDVDAVFYEAYESKEALREDCSAYLTNKMWVYPCGLMVED